VSIISVYAFLGCFPATSDTNKITLGTGFNDPTTITLMMDAFSDTATPNVDLFLGSNVLPAPNIEAKT